MASPMMTTGWVSGRSASLKLRPRRISRPTTSKNSGSTAARYAMKAPWSVGGSNPSTLKSLELVLSGFRCRFADGADRLDAGERPEAIQQAPRVDARLVALALLTAGRELDPDLWVLETKTRDRHLALMRLPQQLSAFVELLEKGERAIDEVIDVMGRATIEAVLQMSAAQVAGPKEQGRRDADREVYWHGVQAGRVALKERQLQVDKPRLRKKRRRADEPGEVEIPAYTALQADQRLADRMLELVLRGVSTRKYETVLPAMEHPTHYPFRRPSGLRHHRP